MGQLAKSFGQRIKTRRAQLRMSQAQLADAADISEEWVRRIEHGEGSPSFDTIEALARALEVLPDELFSTGSADDEAVQTVVAAARRMTPDELAWFDEAARLILRRPSKPDPA